ncbi:autotransporter-associated beta strand repeat-containing protein [Luteolibacter ambystomatis]|uniref:Autotransporter-associated beta strand repeat-containing protein n=1 Tax=Luteolibacter ambystomatis TaxID=2824561 RepID=A0A975J1N1_9BACT|nr:autotransporter-associated beta strand repeat-containing protein [Luteolibacter ambystomatis]QUE52383.1 autotransporter-associated beta strand repeat-containing protein [Luteolibacter ambystomatis]
MKPRHTFSLPALLVLSLSALSAGLATATDIVWDVNLSAGPWDWNTGANWVGGTAPSTSADRADLRKDWTAAATINLSAPTTVNGVLFDDTGSTGDVGVTLGNGGVDANTLTLDGTTPAVNVSGSLTVGAVLAGTTNWSKTGTGTLVLTNANASYTVPVVTVAAGTLQIGSLTASGTVATLLGSGVTIQSGAVMNYPLIHASTTQTGNYTGTTPISVESGGTIRVQAGTGSSIYNIAAPVTVAGGSGSTITIDNNGGGFDVDAHFTGQFSGSGTINYICSTGSGSSVVNRTLTLDNGGTNYSGNWFVDYTGSTTDDFAELASGAAGALGTGSVVLDDRAILSLTAAGGLNSLAGVTIQKSTSTLNVSSLAWANPAAVLTLNAGSVNVGTAASSIGTLTVNASASTTGSTGSLSFATANLNAGTLSGTGILAPAAGGTITNATATAVPTVSAPVDFSSNATVAVSNTTGDINPDLILASVTGSAGFTKTGAGTLRLSGTVTDSAITVATGTLDYVATTPGNGTVTIADGATLSGEAVTGGPLVLGGTTGATVYADISTPGAYTCSNLTINGAEKVVLNGIPVPGTPYTVLAYSGSIGGSGSLSATYRNATFDYGTGANSVVTLTAGAAAALTWTNSSANSLWDTATSLNWNSGAGADLFYNADVVTFNDSPGSNQAVTIADLVSPGGITLSNSTIDYSFSGGPIVGATTLSKTGTGTVSLLSPNSYTGATTLGAGRLRVVNGAVGSGTLSLAGGTLSSTGTGAVTLAAPLSLDGNVTLGHATDNGALTFTGAGVLTGDRTLTTASTTTLGGVLSGAFGLTKEGAGSLTLTGTSTYTGATTINTGTLQVGVGGTTGALAGPVSAASGATLRFFRGDAPIFANVISGAGTVTFGGISSSGLSSYNMTGANTMSGTVIAETGARASFGATGRLGTAAVQVQPGGQIYLSAGTYPNNFSIAGNGWTEGAGQLGAIRVNATVTGSVTLAAAARLATYNGSGTISGALIGTAPLEVNSTSSNFTGTLTYSGNGSGFTGTTTLSQGGLALTGSLGGALNVSTVGAPGAATLSGEGTIGGTLTMGAGSLGSNLTINPTTSGAITATGALTVNNTVNVSLSTTPATAGTVAVLKHGGTTATPANFTLAGAANFRPYSFDTTTDPTTVNLILSGSTLTWKGNLSAVWDINTTANWLNPTPAADTFHTLDSVVFDNNATSFAPTLAVTVNPGSVTFNNTTAYTLTGAGIIAGGGTLTKTGTGSATISTPNTYTGGTTVSQGTLISTITNTVNGISTGPVSVATGATLQYVASNTTNTGNAIGNTITGTGTVSVNFAAGTTARNTSMPNVTGFNGTIVLTNAGSNADKWNCSGGVNAPNASVIVGSGSQLFVNTNPSAFSSVSIIGTGNSETRGALRIGNALNSAVTVGGDAAIGSEGGTINGNVSSGAAGTQNLTIGTTNSTGGLTVNGIIGGGLGNLAIVKSTVGTTTFNGANTYTGGTTINAGGGSLVITQPTGLGTGTVRNLNTSTTTGTLRLQLTGTNTVTNAFTFSSATALSDAAGGGLPQIQNVSGNTTLTGSLTLTAGGGNGINLQSDLGADLVVTGPVTLTTTSTGRILALGGAGTGTISGIISNGAGAQGIRKVGTGTWTLSGANTFGESVFVNNGLLVAGSNAAFGSAASGVIVNAGAVDLNGKGIGAESLTLNGSGISSGGALVNSNTSTTATGSGTVALASAVSIGGAGNTTLSGVISGTGALTKVGAGILTVTGTNTYTGATTVSAGTLAGTGSATSALGVGSGGTVAPGSGIGTFKVAGATLATGATLALQIDSTAITSDRLDSTGGDLTITGANLTFADLGSGTLPLGTKLTLADYTGHTLTGTFNGLAEGATVTVGTNTFALSYVDGSTITLTVQAPVGYSSWAAVNAGGQAANLDYDNDGVRNGVEYLMGQTGSSFTTNPQIVSGTITWPKDPGAVASWVVQTSTDLVTWTTAPSGVSDLGNAIQYVVPMGSGPFFVRLHVTVP